MSLVLDRATLIERAQRAGIGDGTGALFLLPVPSRSPDEARLLLGRAAVTEGDRSWRTPHLLVRLSPWDGSVLASEALPSRMGGIDLRPGELRQRPPATIGADPYFAALAELDALLPFVWSTYLRGERPPRDEVQRYHRAFRTLVRAGEEPYYEAISQDFDDWVGGAL
jgi:hypothetical protein